MGEPVAKTFRVGLVHAAEGYIYTETLIDFVLTGLWFIYNANSKDVVYLIEGDILLLHLIPDRVGAFYASLDGVFDTHLVESLSNRIREGLKQCLTLRIGMLQVLLYLGIFFWIFIMEGKVFEFGLYSIQSETIGQRGIEIKRLACYLAAFLFFLTFYVSHIVEAVAYLDEDDTDVFTHREEELLEIFGLCFGLCTKDAAGNLCQSVNNLCYLCAEDILNIINGIVGILNRVMEQSSANAGRAKSHLL